ncbi:HNH endonuclease signature motif containing protein [Raineyella antarctica]|nr:HNH endonuclease signature motif containing protein [Raineyella antarctica]
MEREWGTRTGRSLAGILDTLDSLDHDHDRAFATDGERLALLDSALQAAHRLQTVASVLAAEIHAAGSDVAATGLSLTSWLTSTHPMTRREASALLLRGRDLAQFPLLREAALAGTASPEQARAITGVLSDLPDDLDAGQRRLAEQTMVDHAADFDSRGLTTLARHLLEVVAPEQADELEAARLEREERLARRNRHLDFSPDGHGSVFIRGKLPLVQAQTLMAQLDAIAHAERRRALDALDPLAEETTPAMRRADALVALAEAAALHGDAPTHGGDRPRVVVHLPESWLRDGATGAGLLASGDRISPGELRRMCCDADLVPVVLGGDSEVLDVGREHRLVTAPIRTALGVRDRGCVFPGCDRPPAACHAHHIIPWQQGGPTSLDNLVLACPHHHAIVEPPVTGPVEHRWQVRLGADGLAEVLPPRRVDRSMAPRRHRRFDPCPVA